MDSVNNGMNAVKGMLFNKKFIIILVVTAIFIGVAFWVYTTYVAPSINPDYVPNREFTDGEGSNPDPDPKPVGVELTSLPMGAYTDGEGSNPNPKPDPNPDPN